MNKKFDFEEECNKFDVWAKGNYKVLKLSKEVFWQKVKEYAEERYLEAVVERIRYQTYMRGITVHSKK